MTLQQNTSDWLEARRSKIGASDAPAILNVDPFSTPYQKWEDKMGLRTVTQTVAMKRGHDLEDVARQQLERLTGFFFLPDVKFHKSIPYLMASLDCIDPTGTVIAEIKCPSKACHQVAHNGEVPDRYYPQLQHQLEVCELEMGYYFSWHGGDGVLVKVYRNDQYIKQMLEKEERFFECMQKKVPPPLIDREYVKKDGALWGI